MDFARKMNFNGSIKWRNKDLILYRRKEGKNLSMFNGIMDNLISLLMLFKIFNFEDLEIFFIVRIVKII